MVAFTNASGTALQRYNSSGAAIGAPISTAGSLAGYDAVALNAAGDLVIVSTTGGADPNITFRRVDVPSALETAEDLAIALTMISAAMSIDPAYFAELFPTRVRASGLAFPYAMGIAFFGGTAPYLHTWMADRGTEWMFTAYSILLFLVTVFAATRSPETVGKDLVDD